MVSAIAKIKHVRISPSKVGIVIDLIRNKRASFAVEVLKNINKAASPVIEKLIRSAISNAKTNSSLSSDNLYIDEIYVGPSSILKRTQPRAKGRGCRINKRSSNVTVILRERNN